MLVSFWLNMTLNFIRFFIVVRPNKAVIFEKWITVFSVDYEKNISIVFCFFNDLSLKNVSPKNNFIFVFRKKKKKNFTFILILSRKNYLGRRFVQKPFTTHTINVSKSTAYVIEIFYETQHLMSWNKRASIY